MNFYAMNLSSIIQTLSNRFLKSDKAIVKFVKLLLHEESQIINVKLLKNNPDLTTIKWI
jgi:hypothetical protein